MSKRSRRKEKESRRVVDKFSLKTWYLIHTPEMFGGDQISETPASDPDLVIGRTISTTLMDLTGDYKKLHVKLTFKINKVRGDKAHTQFHGHEYTRDFLRSMIRRRRTRVDGIFNITTKDGAKLRVSIIALTPFRCKTSHEKGIRKIMFEVVEGRAEKLRFEELVREIVVGKVATEIYKKARKIHPIQNIDVWKSRVISLPTIRLPEEEEETTRAKEETTRAKEETTRAKEETTRAKEETAVVAETSSETEVPSGDEEVKSEEAAAETTKTESA